MMKEEKKHTKDFLDELSILRYDGQFKHLSPLKKDAIRAAALSLIREF